MGQVVRYDIATLRGPERTSQGFLRADAVLTRSGVFLYRNPDGSTRREYRPPEEVFRADVLSSFEDAPLTKLHPGRLVDKTNARQVSVGMVKETPRRDGNHAVARVVVMDADAIAAVESGELRSVSCGYECDYDPTPGVTPEGERYDGIQRNIRGNHVALVPAGRAGPEATIRLDAADAVIVEDAATEPPTKEKTPMAKVRLDGVDFEASEQLAQAISVSQEKAQAREDELRAAVEAAKAEAAKEKARADAAVDQLEKDASAEVIQQKVAARVALEREAAQVLPEAKFDGKTDEEIKTAVITAVHPGARLDEIDPKIKSVYIQARYDAALEAHKAAPWRNYALANANRAATAPAQGGGNEAKRKFYEDEANAWQKAG